MICEQCAIGADLATGRDGTPIQAGAGAANAGELAARIHGCCTGCDCQHRIPPIQPNLPEEVTPEVLARFLEMIRRG